MPAFVDNDATVAALAEAFDDDLRPIAAHARDVHRGHRRGRRHRDRRAHPPRGDRRRGGDRAHRSSARTCANGAPDAGAGAAARVARGARRRPGARPPRPGARLPRRPRGGRRGAGRRRDGARLRPRSSASASGSGSPTSSTSSTRTSSSSAAASRRAGELLLEPAPGWRGPSCSRASARAREIRLARYGPQAGRARRRAARGPGATTGGVTCGSPADSTTPASRWTTPCSTRDPRRRARARRRSAAGRLPRHRAGRRAAPSWAATRSAGSSSAAAARASPWPPARSRGSGRTVAHDAYTAAQCVAHDDCNVIALGARVDRPRDRRRMRGRVRGNGLLGRGTPRAAAREGPADGVPGARRPPRRPT